MDNQAFELLKNKLDELKDDISDIKKDVASVQQDLGHYKGFLGGVSFVFALAWSGVTYFLTNIKGGNSG